MQRPGLGAQIVEMDVVFGGQAVAAEGLQRVRDGAAGGSAFHQSGERDLGARLGLAVGDVADGHPVEVLAAVDLA